MRGSRGGTGGPDPLEESGSNTGPDSMKNHTDIKPDSMLEHHRHARMRHFNGVSLAGR